MDRKSRNLLTRRGLLAGGAFAIASACGRSRATGYPGYALVSTAGENSIAAVDLNSFQVTKKIRLNASPSVVIADSKRVYALTPATGTVHLLDMEGLAKGASLRLADQVDSIRLTPDGKMLAAISSKSRDLILADVESHRVVRRVRLENEPLDLDLSFYSGAKGIYAAISEGVSGVVESVELATGKRARTDLDGELGNLRFRSDGQILLVANCRDRTLVALDSQTLQTICELPLAMRPENLCFSADQGQLFVSGSGMDGVAIVFPFHTPEVEQTVLAGRTPGAMACCGPNPSYLFVASRTGSEISILNVGTRKMIALTQAGQQPKQITVTPDQQYALILNEASGDMAVIRIPNIKGTRLKTGASLFAMVPIGDTPVDTAIFTRYA
jgi:DNA-binding beta-propeller fold protein YncE